VTKRIKYSIATERVMLTKSRCLAKVNLLKAMYVVKTLMLSLIDGKVVVICSRQEDPDKEYICVEVFL